MTWKKHLNDKLKGACEEGKKLSSLTTLGVGGQAEFFIEPQTLDEVVAVFRARMQLGFPLHILAGGTNVVFADGEINGVVMSTRRLNSSRWLDRGEYSLWEAEAGCLLSLMVHEAALEGLGGAEFALGIPGTIGGALAGNAGAGGKSVAELIDELVTVEQNGELRRWTQGQFEYAYRRFSLTTPGRFLARVRMRFVRASRAESERLSERFRQARAIQPHGTRSAGCTFKNPKDESAGRLLDLCGCKGLRVGGARVSDAHANFILNEGHASGSDVLNLMQTCRDIVLKKTGIHLEPEIKFIGFSV